MGSAAVSVICDSIGLKKADLYVNGGCYFKELIGVQNRKGYEVLSHYQNSNHISIVQCNFGEGKAILSGPHLEINHEHVSKISNDLASLSKFEESNHLKELISKLQHTDGLRLEIWKDVLIRLGLTINQGVSDSLSDKMWVACLDDLGTQQFMNRFKANAWSLSNVGNMLLVDTGNTWNICDNDDISHAETPMQLNKTFEQMPIDLQSYSMKINLKNFNIAAYISNLKQHLKIATKINHDLCFGSEIIYCESVTSTQNIIDQ
jgi:hypothetical protein